MESLLGSSLFGFICLMLIGFVFLQNVLFVRIKNYKNKKLQNRYSCCPICSGEIKTFTDTAYAESFMYFCEKNNCFTELVSSMYVIYQVFDKKWHFLRGEINTFSYRKVKYPQVVEEYMNYWKENDRYVGAILLHLGEE